MTWQLVFTKQAHKDAKKLSSAGLRAKAEQILELLAENPFQNSPPYEKLVGDLVSAYSRRTNIQHRLVYQVLSDIQTVKVLRMWTTLRVEFLPLFIHQYPPKQVQALLSNAKLTPITP